MLYPDASFLVSLYGQDGNSPLADAQHQRDGRRPYAFTVFQRHETRNAIRLLAARAGTFTVGNAFRYLDHDLRDGILKHEEIQWPAVFRLAEELGHAHTAKLSCAASDLLHVAIAAHLEADTFLTFDEDQRQLALATRAFKHVPELKPAAAE